MDGITLITSYGILLPIWLFGVYRTIKHSKTGVMYFSAVGIWTVMVINITLKLGGLK